MRSERRRPTAKWWDAYDQRQLRLWWASSIAVRLKNDVWCPCYVEFCIKFWMYSWMIHIPQDLYSVSSKTPYRIILWSLEAARLGFRLQVTFKNMGNQFTQTHNGLLYKPYSTPRVCILYRPVASYNNHRWFMTGEHQRSIIQMKVTGNVYDPVVQIAHLKKYAR